jgi:hypothetical protein
MGNITSTTGGNTILKSRDGTSFSSIPANNTVPIYDLEANLEFNNTITFPKDVTLALGGASADSTKIAYSLDGGITWTPSANSSAVFSNTVYNAAWNGKLWIAVGSGGNTIATSTDGNQWIGRGSYIFTTAGYGIAWSNEQTVWIACGEGTNSLAYSYDGIYWSGLGNTIVNPVYDVEWNGSIWIAAGSPISGNKSITYSYDGLNWQLPTQTNLFDLSAQRLFWNGSFWVGIGKSTVNNGSFNMATSVDGQTWNMINNTSFANEILTNMYSNPKTNTTFFTSYSPALPPTNLSATGKTDTTITISFTAPTSSVTSYTVTAVPTSGTTITQTFNAPATTYTITGLQTLVQYTISMTSTNTLGTSNSSNSITASISFGFSNYTTPITVTNNGLSGLSGIQLVANGTRLVGSAATYGYLFFYSYNGTTWNKTDVSQTDLGGIASLSVLPDGSRGVLINYYGVCYNFTWNSSTQTYSGFTQTRETISRTEGCGFDMTPDGNTIVFTHTNGGNPRYMYFAKWENGNYNAFTQTLDVPRKYFGAGISADGSKIAYALQDVGTVYVAYWNGANYGVGTAISTTSTFSRHVRFSPDGKIIYNTPALNASRSVEYSILNGSTYSAFTNVATTSMPANIDTGGFFVQTDGSICMGISNSIYRSTIVFI